jgi:hypothetical protein
VVLVSKGVAPEATISIVGSIARIAREKAYEERDQGTFVLKTDPTLDPLRSDPRFEDLLRRMNFPS